MTRSIAAHARPFGTRIGIGIGAVALAVPVTLLAGCSGNSSGHDASSSGAQLSQAFTAPTAPPTASRRATTSPALTAVASHRPPPRPSITRTGPTQSSASPTPATSAPPVTPPPATTSTASIAGCPLFPASNPWRQDISRAAVDPHSSAWVANIGASTHLHPDFGSDPSYGIPYVTVPAAQAKVPIRFDAYGDESDAGPYPIPANARIEAGGDAHVLVASGDCHIYELYGARRSGTGWVADSGAVFNLLSNQLRPAGWTSADAAGLPILPGLVRPDEIRAGQIDHALRFTVSRSQRGYIAPARHQAGSTSDADVVPMGARFRLKASFDISGYHGAARIILQCLKTYGMFVADNGSNWFLSGATYTGWNDDDLNQLKAVPGSAFEAVATGAVQH
jgi:hypothetical protein